MDTQHAQLDRIERTLVKRITDLEKRVGLHDRDRWYQRGIVAAIAMVISLGWEFWKK